MTVLDSFVMVVVGVSVALGATRGILRGIVSVVFAVVGLLAATELYGQVALLFRHFVSTQRGAAILGFIAVFLFVLFSGSLLARLLYRGMKRAKLSWVDRLMGTMFGLLRGWLICSAIYLAFTAFPVKLGVVEQATFAPVLLRGAKVISFLTSPEFREQFQNGYEAIQAFWRQKS